MWTVYISHMGKLPCLLLDVFFYLAFHSRLTFPEYLLRGNLQKKKSPFKDII